MILAAIEGQILVLLLMALFGFISWLSGKLNPGDKKAPPQTPRAPGNALPRRASAESEEERMRRFLEALGLPTGEPPVPPQPVQPRVQPRPAPPVVVAPPPIPAPSKPKPRPVASPPSPEPALDELDAPTLAVERIELPQLMTASVPEFDTVSSKISATHREFGALREITTAPSTASVYELLRASLASPQQLRAAFVLREIIGPPPGLRGS